MEKIILEELNNKKNELKKLQQEIEDLNIIIEDLKKEDIVKRYIDANERYTKNKNKVESLQEQIKYQNMLHCIHYFVINDIDESFDGHRTDTTYIVTCIHCGLTNRFMNSYRSPFALRNHELMNEIFINNNCYYLDKHGNYSYQELPELKKLYNKFTDEYPNAKDKDIEKQIALVKKMRGGKLC